MEGMENPRGPLTTAAPSWLVCPCCNAPMEVYWEHEVSFGAYDLYLCTNPRCGFKCADKLRVD